MLLLLHEQDKMAPGGRHPEVNNNIRFPSEVIFALITGKPSFYWPSTPQLQGGLKKGGKRCLGMNNVHISKMSISQPRSFVTKETRMLRNRVFLT
uniref:Uncharacterized protein n=1 Tax=Peromyscus maniculatus bairdii TaxID=230844 RepID=A0A8C8UJZ1_PERMB